MTDETLTNETNWKDVLRWAKAQLPSEEYLDNLSSKLDVENLRKIDNPSDAEALLKEIQIILSHISETIKKW